MSLSGDLKHFPIIDIIQLLHGSRKSGLLRLTGDEGESQLVFHEGDLVSASYLNGTVRIGQVLVGAGAIAEEQLARALETQERAGSGRKPLVVTLLEQGVVDEHAAYTCLESLIEMTIVQALTWKGGRFSLEMDDGGEGGERRFRRPDFPQPVLLNSQGILMESLRILDEKMRDGTMDDLLSIAGLSDGELEGEQTGSDGRRDDAAIMLQQLLMEQRGMMQRGGDQSYRTAEALVRLMDDEFPGAPQERRSQLTALLAGEGEPPEHLAPAGVAVIVISRSRLVAAMIRSLCHQEGIFAAAVDAPAEVPINVRLLLCQGLHPVIFLDVPHGDDQQDAIRSCLALRRQSRVSLVLVACAAFWGRLALQALASGIRSVIPRPCPHCAEDPPIQQALAFCSGLSPFLRALSSEYGESGDRRLFACISRLNDCCSGSEVTDTVLAYLMDSFERAVLFRVTRSGLVAEQGFGIGRDKRGGVTPLEGVEVAGDDQEIFERVVSTGQLFYGFHSDSTWPHEFYRLVGRPESPEVLLFPLIRVKTVTAFIYADCGRLQAPSPPLDQLQALLQFTSSRISILAYRQKLKAMLDSGGRGNAADREQ